MTLFVLGEAEQEFAESIAYYGIQGARTGMAVSE